MGHRFHSEQRFTYAYKADCLTCRRYVGKKHKIRDKAVQDSKDHRAEPGNKEHDVQIEITQRSYLR